MKKSWSSQMWDYWPAIFILIFLVLSAFASESGLRLLFDVPEDYSDYSPGKYRVWIVAVFMLIGLSTLIAAQYFIQRTKVDFAEYKTLEDNDRQRVAREKAEATQRAEREALEQELAERIQRGDQALADRITSLESQGYRRIHTRRIENDLRITQGQLEQSPDSASSTLRVEVDDIYGNDKILVVFHLFENSAFWKFDSASSLEVTEPLASRLGVETFGGLVERSPLANTLPTYDLLVGLGQESNSERVRPDMAFNRAAHMCSLLLPYAGSREQVFGLDVGRYVGPEKDTASNPDKRQRSAIVVGIVIHDLDAGTEQHLLERVIQEVSYSGLDLTKFSNFRVGQMPAWLSIEQCEAPF